MPPQRPAQPRAPYFIVDPRSISDDRLILDPVDAHHLEVRRIRPGDLVRVGDGAGRVHEARVEKVGADRAEASMLSSFEVPRPQPRITVLQGLAKGSKVDWAVEKMVELGVDRIVVFTSGRSIPQWDAAKAEGARQRWRRVARAAAKQSRRAWLPLVEGPFTLDQAVEAAAELPMVLVGDPGAPRRLRDSLPAEPPAEIGLVVGPEGGLATDEVKAFERADAVVVDLGSQVLRTETAGLAVAAAVMFAVGRLG
jgi:16S rRNA (uracil1498-N3)-methyltransferase